MPVCYSKLRRYWVVSLHKRKRSASGQTAFANLDGIEAPDLLMLPHSVPAEEKQRAIRLFKGRCGSPVLSLLSTHVTKLPEADYGVEALNPEEFVAAVKDIFAARSS